VVPASNGQWGFIGQQNPCSGYIVGHSETDPLAFLFRSGGRGRLPDGVRGKQSFSTRDREIDRGPLRVTRDAEQIESLALTPSDDGYSTILPSRCSKIDGFR